MPDIAGKLFPNVTTIIVQLLSTGVLFLVFKKYLWVPVQNYFAKRADYIEGTVKEAEQMNKKAKALMEESQEQARQAAIEYREIETEKLQAKAEMKQEIVEIAIDVATKVMDRDMDTTTNKALVENFVEEVVN